MYLILQITYSLIDSRPDIRTPCYELFINISGQRDEWLLFLSARSACLHRTESKERRNSRPATSEEQYVSGLHAAAAALDATAAAKQQPVPAAATAAAAAAVGAVDAKQMAGPAAALEAAAAAQQRAEPPGDGGAKSGGSGSPGDDSGKVGP